MSPYTIDREIKFFIPRWLMFTLIGILVVVIVIFVVTINNNKSNDKKQNNKPNLIN